MTGRLARQAQARRAPNPKVAVSLRFRPDDLEAIASEMDLEGWPTNQQLRKFMSKAIESAIKGAHRRYDERLPT